MFALHSQYVEHSYIRLARDHASNYLWNIKSQTMHLFKETKYQTHQFAIQAISLPEAMIRVLIAQVSWATKGFIYNAI